MTAHHLDRAIEALARRQHGVFNRTQARDLGASASFMDRRVRSGRWIKLTSGVYALGGNPPSFERQCMAAVLAEPVAWVSGRSAAALHGFDGFRPGRIEITVPSRASHRNALASVRRSDEFRSARVSGIPVGTIEQTICDLACSISLVRLEAVIDLLIAARRTTVVKLEARFQELELGTQYRRRPLARILASRGDAYVPATSLLELALYRVLDDGQLPAHERQPRLPWRRTAGERPDAIVPAWRLIIEADGRAWHTRVADFERDRRRDRDALAHGYAVARYVYSELVEDPKRVIEDLQRIGDARSGMPLAG